jgi:hypothetical protein
MIKLQIPLSKELLSTTDATTTGVLIVGIIALSAVVVFLFREYKILNSEFKEYMKASNETLVKMNNSYNQFVSNMIELKKR